MNTVRERLQRWWWDTRWHRHSFVYRKCTVAHHYMEEPTLSSFRKMLDHHDRSECNDLWVCACGVEMETGQSVLLPVARLL